MPIRFFSRFKNEPPEEPENELVQQLRAAGAKLQRHAGLPTSVEIEHTATDELLQLIASSESSENIEQIGLDWCYEITDDGVRHLAALKKLRQLRLAGAAIDGSGLEAFADHPALEILELDGSSIDSSALAQVARIPNLTSLFLRYTSVDDAGLALLCPLGKLSVLHLDGTAVTGAGLPSIRALKKLEVLSLPTAIRGDDLPHLHGLGRLRWIWLGDAGVDNESVETLKSNLNPMCSVSWRRKQSVVSD